MKFKKWAVVAAALFVIGTSRVANAASLTYLLTSDHCTGGCGTAPFGSVLVAESGSNVDFTVSLTSGYNWAKTGAGDDMMFKFNAAGVVVGDISVTSSPYSGFTLTAATGNFSGDGTGDFAFGIQCGACGGGGGTGRPPYVGPLTFTVANASLADVTGVNNLGITFVADVVAPNGNTGPVDATVPTTSVPDGGMTMSLLGLALTGLGLMARRRA